MRARVSRGAGADSGWGYRIGGQRGSGGQKGGQHYQERNLFQERRELIEKCNRRCDSRMPNPHKKVAGNKVFSEKEVIP